MKINSHIFRGYDLRGIVGQDLNAEIVEHIGKAYGTYLKRKGITKAIVSRDSRRTSPEYSKVLIKGLNWAGIEVIDIGLNLIGTFYWSQYHFKIKGGVYITASHNPPQFNGFKFAIDYSETLVSEGMQEIKRIVEQEDYDQAKVQGKLKEVDIRKEYFKDLVLRLPLKKKLKVVIDAGNATSGVIAPDLLRLVGCEVIEANCNLDSNFPLGSADPTDFIMANRLAARVLEERADIGFSFDADGDRIGIADEKGHIILNDVLVALLAINVLRKHPGSVIMYNTLCSKVVEDTIKREGGIPFMWRTGHSFLKKKNQEVKAAFIGELSGHFFFSRDFYNHDDGLYSMLYLINYLSNTGLSLSSTVTKLPFYISSPEIKIFCSDEKKVEVMKDIAKTLKRDFPEADVIDDERAGDGVRLNLKDSMLVIRYSQNGPYLTIKFESKKKDQYKN